MFYSKSLPTNEIIQRVLNIQYNEKLGSAFTVTKNDIQFIITAKHLFESVTDESEINISILQLDEWISLKVRVYLCQDNIDIAVLELLETKHITPVFHNLLSTKGAIYGQDVYFYGFPYGIHMKNGTDINGNLPIPLVKKACLSAIECNLSSDILLFDGINNPGFSGGPVTFCDMNTLQKNICGVISGYLPESTPVINLEDKYVKQNTGIILVYNIKHAVEKIKDILSDNTISEDFYG